MCSSSILMLMLVSLALCIDEVFVLDDQDQKALEELNLGGVVDVEHGEGDQQQDGISITALRPDYAIPRFVNLLQSMFEYNGQHPEKRRVRQIDDEPTYTHPILRTHRLFVNFGKYRG